jgi:hypothetical protein
VAAGHGADRNDIVVLFLAVFFAPLRLGGGFGGVFFFLIVLLEVSFGFYSTVEVAITYYSPELFELTLEGVKLLPASLALGAASSSHHSNDYSG